MYVPRTSLYFTPFSKFCLVSNQISKFKACRHNKMPNCLPECNNIGPLPSHHNFGVFWIIYNTNIQWICIINLCLKRNTSFSSSISTWFWRRSVSSLCSLSVLIWRLGYWHVHFLIIDTHILLLIIKNIWLLSGSSSGSASGSAVWLIEGLTLAVGCSTGT